MPDKRTFQIKPIKEIIRKYTIDGYQWIDPFPYPFRQDALEYLASLPNESVKRLLFDPPYSMRQLKECYDSLGQALGDTTCGLYAKWKDAIARVVMPGGIVLSFGWNSNGIGQSRGFWKIDGMLVAHGGCHNDTIVTIERKMQATLHLQ